MRIEGLKDGVYDPDEDVFLDSEDPEIEHVIGSRIKISDGKISGTEYGSKYSYHLFEISFVFDLVGNVGIPGGSSREYARSLVYNASISFDEQYTEYLANQIKHLRDKYSAIKGFRSELEISRFLIKEMEKLIYYKENVHDIPVRRHFYTDKPVDDSWPINVTTKSADRLADQPR